MTELAQCTGPSPPLACSGVPMVATRLLVGAELMIFARLDRFATENVVDVKPVALLVSPLLHRLEHFALDLNAIVSDGGVVERAEDIVDDFVHGDVCMLPCV